MALALLLQVMFAAPLALRMAAASAGDDATACAPADAAPDHRPAPLHGPPLHGHEPCPLCGSHAAPVALPEAAPPLPPPATAWLPPPPARTAPPSRPARFTPYRSRAPPAAA